MLSEKAVARIQAEATREQALETRNALVELMGEFPPDIQMQLLAADRFQALLDDLDPDNPAFRLTKMRSVRILEGFALEWLIAAEIDTLALQEVE